MSIKAMNERVVDLWENPVAMINQWAVSEMKERHEKLAASWVVDEGYGVIADLGCGPGRLVPVLDVTTDEYIGYDQSMAMIAEAKERYPDHEFALADIFRFSPDEMYDTVLMLDVAQHQDRPLDALLTIMSLWRADKYVMSLIVGDKYEELLMSKVVPLSGLLNVFDQVRPTRMYMERYGNPDHKFAWTLIEFWRPDAVGR